MDSKSLDEILEKLNSAEFAAEEKEVEQPSPDAEGLVFEYFDNAENKEDEETLQPIEEPADEDTSDVTESDAVAKEQADYAEETVSDEEVMAVLETQKSDFVGDIHVEAPTETPHEDASARIWSTYVPRFTEVSETYRLRGDKRLRAILDEKKQSGEITEDEEQEKIDPTAEFEENYEAVPAVVLERKETEEKVESISIYKFENDDEEEDFVEEINGVTVEDEAKKIEELLAKEAALTPPSAPEAPEEEPVVEESMEEEKGDMADPDDGEFRVIDYGSAPEEPEDNPSGIEESVDSTRDKRGLIKEFEFTNPVQRDSFKDKFLDSLMSIKIRFAMSAGFAVVILILEMLSSLDVISFSLLPKSQVHSALAVVDYLLATCTFALCLPEIVKAVKYLIGKKVMPDVLLIVGFAVLSLYTLTVVLTGATYYPLFGFLFALMSLCSISASKYRTKADFLAFKVISQNEEKQILDKRFTRELTMENMALDGVVDEYSSKIVRTFRASFVSDFFKNCADVSGVPAVSLTVLCVTLGVGLVAGLVAFFLMKSVLGGVALFTLAYMLGMPMFSLMSNKLSFYQSQRAAVLEESAAVGEGAFHDFSSADVVAFDDTDIFGPEDVNLKRFMLYGDRDNMEKAMRQMCALFAVAGGPLDFMFTNAIDNRVRHKSATNTVIEDDGISGDVMGHRICAGSQEYMIRNGIAIPEAARSTDVSLDTTKVLYAAEDGEVYAKFYIRYSFSEEFTSFLPALKEKGIIPLIYTRDPNISNELLDTLTAGADCMRVVKIYKPIPREEKVYSRVNAKMVTFGDKLNAISMILLSKKYKSFSEKLSFTELCATGIGLTLAIILGIIGISGASVFVSILWQVVWCVALHYMSHIVFLKDATSKKDDD